MCNERCRHSIEEGEQSVAICTRVDESLSPARPQAASGQALESPYLRALGARAMRSAPPLEVIRCTAD